MHAMLCRPQELMLLCEFVLNSMRAPPSEALLYHTLLQLYLAENLCEDPEGEESGVAVSQTKRRCGQTDKRLIDSRPVRISLYQAVHHHERYQQSASASY